VVFDGDSYQLYSRSVNERSYWLQSFCRVLDFNKGISPEESGKHSPAYQVLIDNNKGRQKITYDKSKHKPDANSEDYSSKHLTYNDKVIRGSLYKKIEAVSWYH
jgi:hypothetical protein